MGRRRDRLDKRQANQRATRQRKSFIKALESNRREKQIIEILKKGQMPYTPGVMSWLSVKLNKKASRITQQDIQQLIAS